MSDCIICGCEFKTCKRCADPERAHKTGYTKARLESTKEIESLKNQLASYSELLEKLTICQCSEMDVEFGIHCNSCVKDKIEKLQNALEASERQIQGWSMAQEKLMAELAEANQCIKKLTKHITSLGTNNDTK